MHPSPVSRHSLLRRIARLALALTLAPLLPTHSLASGEPIEPSPQPPPTSEPQAATAAQPAKPTAPPPGTVIRQKNFLTPAIVLQELRAETDTSDDANRTRSILSAALTANWPELSLALKSIPDPKQASDAFSALLEKIAQSSKVPTFNPAAVPNYYGEAPPERQDQNRPHLLVSSDFSQLLAAAPAPPSSTDLTHLATIGKVALNAANRSQLAAQLEAGLGSLGGKDPTARAHAATILSTLGEPKHAKAFLPTENDPNDPKVSVPQLLSLIQYHAELLASGAPEGSHEKAALTCTALSKRIAETDQPTRNLLAERLPALLNAMRAEQATLFIQNEILPQPALLNAYAAHLLQRGNVALKSLEEITRTASITSISRFLNAFEGTKISLPQQASSLALLWIDEAESALRYLPDHKEDEDGRRRIGRMYGFVDPSLQGSRFIAIPRATLHALAPKNAVLHTVNSALAQRVQQIQLLLKLGDPDATTLNDLKEFLQTHPELRSSLATRYLEGWIRQRSQPEESEEVKQMRMNGFFIPKPSALPTTRARQIQNLKELAELLPTLKTLSENSLKPQLQVKAFAALHSPSEVFLATDIEAIFGKTDALTPDIVAELAAVMRKNLASIWDDPATQQQQGTKRTRTEIKQQVRRGYAIASELVRKSLAKHEGDWKSLRTCALTLFDAAEFEFQEKGPLDTYLAARKEALTLFQRSAEAYNASVPSLPEAQWNIDPYLPWISAMLGATDLTRIRWSEGRPEPAYETLSNTLNALPPEAAKKHQGLLVKLAESSLPNIQPAMRQKILAAIDQIVGPTCQEAANIRRILETYRQLTAESRLVLKIDGQSRIHPETPFGVMLSIEYTHALGRESGHFTKYLLNPGTAANNNPFFNMMPGGQKPPNYRDDLLKNVRAALQNTFEILAHTFHSETVTPQRGHADGWSSTPLAYLVLKPKNAAVDVIPPIQIDLEFAEASQQVILPVTSQAEPLQIDPSSPIRPTEDLGITVVVDEREWNTKRRIQIEIDARAKGLLPDFNAIFRQNFKGFETHLTDNGNNLDEFKTDEEHAWAQSSRSWQIVLTPEATSLPRRIYPPALRDGISGKVEYRSYRDADLIPQPETVTKSGIPLTGSSPWALAALAAFVAVATASALVIRRKLRSSPRPNAEPGVPNEITAISTLRFLNRCVRSGNVPEALQETLAVDIRRLETQCFSPTPQSSPPSPHDLQTLIQRYRSFAS